MIARKIMLRVMTAACTAALLPTYDSAVAAPAAQTAPPKSEAKLRGCVPGGGGFLRARLRGAVTLDLDWNDARMECAGGLRPDGKGLRVSIGGPYRGAGRRIRFVFGLSAVGEGADGKSVPTNVTVIFEGEKRLFATQGDDKCSVDTLQQERLPAIASQTRSYRVTARGFCTGPAATLTRGDKIWITSFDFVGRADMEDLPAHGKASDGNANK
jgi:hypothetical protein